jgi:hypothetical protein
MKSIKYTASLLVLISVHLSSLSQNLDLLDKIPNSKEEFILSEKKAMATINWLESTPMDQDTVKYKTQAYLLFDWLGRSSRFFPEYKYDFNVISKLSFPPRNRMLLVFFQGGWTRYALENKNSLDKVKGVVAGIRLAIKIYKQRKILGTTRQAPEEEDMDKIVKIEEKGELEKWVAEMLAKN